MVSGKESPPPKPKKKDSSGIGHLLGLLAGWSPSTRKEIPQKREEKKEIPRGFATPAGFEPALPKELAVIDQR
jgi:hypothetical protein